MEKRYQVFISSTFADLEEERKGVMEAIIELDCFPAGMEMFPAADVEQFEYIKTIIDESDYYVIVVAGRYGSTDVDGISFTQKEYEYALEKEIPVLAFIKKNEGLIPVEKTDEDPDKKAKLEEFKKELRKGRLVKPWDTAEELKYVLHSSLSKTIKMYPRKGWIREEMAKPGLEARALELSEQNSSLQEALLRAMGEAKMLREEKASVLQKREEIEYESLELTAILEYEDMLTMTRKVESIEIDIADFIYKNGYDLLSGVSYQSGINMTEEYIATKLHEKGRGESIDEICGDIDLVTASYKQFILFLYKNEIIIGINDIRATEYAESLIITY